MSVGKGNMAAARMFWGTDITRMPCSWRKCVTMFTEELPWLSPREKELTDQGQHARET